MSKRNQVLVVLGVVAIAVLGALVGFLLANDSADDDGDRAVVTDGSTSTTAAPGDSTTSTSAAPTGLPLPTPVPTDGLTGPALDLATSINRASTLTYHAVYEGDAPSSSGGTSHTTIEIWRQMPLARRDTFIASPKGTLHAMELRLADQLVGCTDKNKGDVAPDWVCLPKPEDGTDPAEPVVGRARPTDGVVATSTATVGGVPSTCFTVTSASKVQQVCFDRDGIPTSIDGGGSNLVRTELSRGVDPAIIAIPEGAEMRSGSTTTVAGPA